MWFYCIEHILLIQLELKTIDFPHKWYYIFRVAKYFPIKYLNLPYLLIQ